MHINMLKLAMFLWRSRPMSVKCYYVQWMFLCCDTVPPLFEEATVHLHDQQVTFHQCVLIQFFK